MSPVLTLEQRECCSCRCPYRCTRVHGHATGHAVPPCAQPAPVHVQAALCVLACVHRGQPVSPQRWIVYDRDQECVRQRPQAGAVYIGRGMVQYMWTCGRGAFPCTSYIPTLLPALPQLLPPSYLSPFHYSFPPTFLPSSHYSFHFRPRRCRRPRHRHNILTAAPLGRRWAMPIHGSISCCGPCATACTMPHTHQPPPPIPPASTYTFKRYTVCICETAPQQCSCGSAQPAHEAG